MHIGHTRNRAFIFVLCYQLLMVYTYNNMNSVMAERTFKSIPGSTAAKQMKNYFKFTANYVLGVTRHSDM